MDSETARGSEKEGCARMRKVFLWLAVALAMVICMPALAETYIIDDLFASIEIPGEYIVLTPKNLSNYAQWLDARGGSLEETSADFERRGVQLQAWSENFDLCFELRATQSQKTELIFDVNEQSEAVRRDYRTSHYPNNEYEGYDFSSSEWKNTGLNGRFLILKYVKRDNSEVLHRGFMRRTIRNGYQIDFDMQVHGRGATDKDNGKLNKIWETFDFIEILPMPPKAAAKIAITKEPPEETNQKSFTIEGTAEPGVKFTAVVMRLNDPEPVVIETTANKNSVVEMPITLPKDGVFVVTLTAEYQDDEVMEMVYPVTYQSTLLAVNFTTKPGEVSTQDSVKFAGTGEPGASIQVFVNNEVVMTKKVTSEGKFSITVDAAEEGPYDVSLVFSKKKLADRRFTFHFTRKWTDEDMMAYLKKQSISPTYAQLKKEMAKYEGRIMAFKSYILDVSPSGDEYIIRMALNKSEGKYKNIILVTTRQEPTFEVGDRVMMYGTCEGMSLSTGTVGDDVEEESYPCFELLLFASLE